MNIIKKFKRGRVGFNDIITCPLCSELMAMVFLSISHMKNKDRAIKCLTCKEEIKFD